MLAATAAAGLRSMGGGGRGLPPPRGGREELGRGRSRVHPPGPGLRLFRFNERAMRAARAWMRGRVCSLWIISGTSSWPFCALCARQLDVQCCSACWPSTRLLSPTRCSSQIIFRRVCGRCVAPTVPGTLFQPHPLHFFILPARPPRRGCSSSPRTARAPASGSAPTR
jgi:hypothetical protein